MDTEEYDFEDLPVSLDIALGRLARRFGQVEHILGLIIRRGTGNSFAETLARLGTDLKPRPELLQVARRSFVGWAQQEFDEPESSRRIAEFDRSRNILGPALDRRDELTHCAWGKDKREQVRAARHGMVLHIDGAPAGEEHVDATANALWGCFRTLNKISSPSDSATRYNSNVETAQTHHEFSATAAVAPTVKLKPEDES